MPVTCRSKTLLGLALGLLAALCAPAPAQPSVPPTEAMEIRVRQILVETEEEAKEIAAALKAGADFVELVKRSKEEGAVQRGGDLGYLTEKDTLPAFWAAAVALAPGQISEPLHTEFGWHILKREDAQESPLPRAAVAKEIRVRQILVETEQEAKEIAAALKAGGDFAELITRSKETGAAQRGGDLGYLIEEDTLPAFWAAAAALEPGQVSQPLQTEFGWHVLKVEDKRDRTVSLPQRPTRPR